LGFIAVIAAGVSIYVFGLLGFVLASSSPLAEHRYAFVGAYVASTAILFLTAALKMRLRDMIASAAAMAVASVAVHQVLAFGRYPGLAKGFMAFSADHLEWLALVLAAFLVWYMFIAGVAYGLRGRGHRKRIPLA
jgi:hypothetical protein